MYTTSNILKGRILEDSIYSSLTHIGITVKKHHTNTGGLDLEATMGTHTKYGGSYSIIGESINWYGGYIHPLRFKDITEKLSVKADIKFFFCAGVKPTREQSQVLRSMNVKVIHLPKQVLKKSSAVITSILYSILPTIAKYISINCNKIYSSIRSKFYRILHSQGQKQKGEGYSTLVEEIEKGIWDRFSTLGTYISKVLLSSVTSEGTNEI